MLFQQSGWQDGSARLSTDARGVLSGEVFPGCAFAATEVGARSFDIVTIGCAKGIGGVHIGEHGLLRNVQEALQHTRHLLFAGTAVARDGLLDFQRGVLVDGHIATDGCGDGHSLRASEFEHTLHVLTAEGGLDGQFVGQVFLNDTAHALVDSSEFEIAISAFPQVDDAHRQHRHPLPLDLYSTIAQHIRAGVNA